jgi:hypothetical protein
MGEKQKEKGTLFLSFPLYIFKGFTRKCPKIAKFQNISRSGISLLKLQDFQ